VIDLVVENLALSGCNLFPNITPIEANNFIKFSLTSTASSSLPLSRRCMRDVVFYFRRKTGIKITGSGLGDIVLGVEGLTLCFVLLHLLMGVLMCTAQVTASSDKGRRPF
jgi:hypothetical protein